MKLRNIAVVIAIFESYLYIRKNSWKMDSKDLTKAPSDRVAADKFNFCHSMITEIQVANTMDDYVKLLHKLAAKEALEAESVKNSWLRPLDVFGFVYEPPLLLETTRAARAYLISQLREQKEFNELVSGLKSEMASLDEKQKALETSDKKLGEISVAHRASLQSKLSDLNGLERSVCDEYHVKVTTNKDNRSMAVDLHELKFETFEKNVLEGRRAFHLSLLKGRTDRDQKATNAAPVVQSPAVQSSVALAAIPLDRKDEKSSVIPSVSAVSPRSSGAAMASTSVLFRAPLGDVEQMADVISSRSSLSPRNTGAAVASTSAAVRVASIGSTAFAIQTWASRLGTKAKDSSDKNIKAPQAPAVSATGGASAAQTVSASGLSPAAQAVLDKAPLIKVTSPPSSPITIPKRPVVKKPRPPKKHQGRPTLNFEPDYSPTALKFKPY